MKLVSGIVDSGFFAQSALSAEVATKDSLGRNISETYLTGVDLTPYQTTAGMTAYLTTGDSAEFMTTAERSDYIPTGVSSEFYTTANTAGYISTIPDTYLQNTDLSTEDGKVTAISGIPLSAGGDVPEGVMVESGLEYNAVNEISGYNGSAIAQYGAEKQWLVHDDTLVHAANSAQYALGVNVSALQRLMGIDETVLYSGVRSSAANLGEKPTNFKRLRVEDIYHNLYEFVPSTGDVHQEIKLTNFTGQPQQLYVQFSATNDKLYITKGFQTVYSTWDAPGNTTWTASNVNNTYSREIITGITGIGRKA